MIEREIGGNRVRERWTEGGRETEPERERHREKERAREDGVVEEMVHKEKERHSRSLKLFVFSSSA